MPIGLQIAGRPAHDRIAESYLLSACPVFGNTDHDALGHIGLAEQDRRQACQLDTSLC